MNKPIKILTRFYSCHERFLLKNPASMMNKCIHGHVFILPISLQVIIYFYLSEEGILQGTMSYLISKIGLFGLVVI